MDKVDVHGSASGGADNLAATGVAHGRHHDPHHSCSLSSAWRWWLVWPWTLVWQALRPIAIAARGSFIVRHSLAYRRASEASHAQIPVLHVGRGGKRARGTAPHHAAPLDQHMAIGDAYERADVLVDDQD